MGIFRYTTSNASVTVHDHHIVSRNMWKLLPTKAETTLDVDGTRIVTNNDLVHLNPNTPLIRAENISKTIHSIEVFVIGVTSVKLAISVNGKFVYQDKISAADKLQAKAFDQ